jgi:hypothetical protein
MAAEDMITAQASFGMSGAFLINRVRPCDKSTAAPNPVHFPLIEHFAVVKRA